MPQSLPAAQRNFSASRMSFVKIAEVRPCGTPFLNRDCFVEIAIGQQIKQRPERFMTHNLKIGFRVRQARRHVAAARILRAFEPLAAVKNFAALILQSLDGLLHHAHGVLLDQRTHHRLAIERIPNSQRLVCAKSFLRTLSAIDSCMMTRRVEVQR